MKWPTVRQWLETNSLLFVYADDDRNKVAKLEMMDVVQAWCS